MQKFTYRGPRARARDKTLLNYKAKVYGEMTRGAYLFESLSKDLYKSLASRKLRRAGSSLSTLLDRCDRRSRRWISDGTSDDARPSRSREIPRFRFQARPARARTGHSICKFDKEKNACRRDKVVRARVNRRAISMAIDCARPCRHCTRSRTLYRARDNPLRNSRRHWRRDAFRERRDVEREKSTRLEV